jgi:prefoldin subunit 5
MNKIQRKQIEETIEYLQKIHDNIDYGFTDNVSLQDMVDEEQGKLDNLPESFQSKAEKYQTDIDNLETAISYVEESAEYLSQAMDAIENTINALNEI